MPAAAPFYLDWTFWAFATSAIAILLSQLPPIKSWFAGPKLIVEAPTHLRISHVAGNPTMGVVLGLRNVGGRPVRIKSMKFKLIRDKRDHLEVPITEFHPNPTNNQALLLVPFSLTAGADITRSYNAYRDLSRDETRRLTQLISNVRRDIGAKVDERDSKPEQPRTLVELDDKFVSEALAMFNARFWWKAGEYEVEIEVTTEEACEVKQSKKAFTVWESDEADLRALTSDYKHGFGIGVPNEKHAGIFVKLVAR